jgi:hypothetical protein
MTITYIRIVLLAVHTFIILDAAYGSLKGWQGVDAAYCL